ncbi:cytochrome P450 4c3-like [Ixodes scapularis]|uniref:cytochrome P450 4c3-like n=1 Tax=Ixodes scapularis TaxID=6945 RepID=UPI001AD63E51|nr:cytochrome P450 4c3-like [Ixodes scapularis]
MFEAFCGFSELTSREGIFQFWIGLQPFVVLHTAETIEPLLSSNLNIDKTEEYHFMNAILGEGLLTSSGAKWRKRRKMLTPAFHFRVLESCMTIFNDQARVFLHKLHESSHLDYVDIFPMMTHCSLDILCESAMGIKLQSQETSKYHYVQNLHSILTVGMERLNKPWLWWNVAYSLSHQNRNFKTTALQINQFVREVIQERKKVLCSGEQSNGPNCAKAFLDLLIKHHIEDRSFTEKDINEEVNTFLFAGHETTAIGMTYVLYLLGLHPDIQEKVARELDSIFMGDTEREITREDISAMKYLECVIKECQRLYTIVPIYGRRIEEDMSIGNYQVPRGCTCIILSQMVHKDPRYFPNPSVFNPDRFLPENCKGRHPYAFIPFSAGPRNCVGQKFAMMEEKVLVSAVLRQFRIKSLDHRDRLILVPLPLLHPRSTQGGIRIRFTPRERRQPPA